MKINNVYIVGIIIILIGGAISWHAFLKETDRKKKWNKITIGTSISMFGLGVALTAASLEYKLIK